MSLDLDLPRAARPPREKRPLVDPLALAAALFLLIAVGAAAYPVIKAGPLTAPALLLLVGLAGVAVVGVIAFLSGDSAGREVAAVPPDLASTLVTSLSEPACVVRADGRLMAANSAWREAMGAGARLPKSGSELYAALVAARRDGASTARLRDQPVNLARVAGGGILLRFAAAPMAARATADAPAASPLLAPPAALDAFAAAAPFGAALLEGDQPFEGVILQANGALLTLTGGRAEPGVRFGDLLDPSGLGEAAQRLAAKPGAPVEVRLAEAGKDGAGRIAHLYLTSAEGRLVVYLVDVSEQKQLELQLAQSQKMQAIGQLAGGVAHDFNNLLMAIQMHLSELQQRHPIGDPSYEGLNEIKQTAVRAADLVKKLLAFSRKQTVQRETLELGELISEFEVLLRRLLREDVRLENDYGRDLPLVRADKSQLETAVMNLAVNARDALRSHGTGDGGAAVVRIRVARLGRLEAVSQGFPGCPDEGCALIEVKDNGPGIPPEVMEKIFEPFFTTKPLGEGTGLGLATVYGIVKQADGWIWVDSEPGKGAAFRIFLPIYIPPAVLEGAPAPVRTPLKFKPAPRDLSGAGRILFVEDEDAVRTVAARLLRARGYEVIEAADGEEALELAETHAGEIDLLISDVVMPGLDGPALLKKARPFLADAKVMFISGYAEAEFSDLLEGESDITFVAKPIDIKILAERVKQQLQA